MNDWQQVEHLILAPQAAFSDASRGRLRPQAECELRTCYQRDRDRIIHCKTFRRLKAKTQVFVAAEGDHYRTRLTHTLEVAQISRTIARALRLNEDLTEAIALGHDLGHTPFGHAGERSLRALTGHFEHNEQSLRVVDYLEQEGRGLNLTFEVRDGILNHTGEGFPATLEGEIVRLSDRIAYINHDIDDAIRAGLLTAEMLPELSLRVLGQTHGVRIDTLVHDVVQNSQDLQRIRMSQPVEQAMLTLRDYLMEKVYLTAENRRHEQELKEQLTVLYTHYCKNIQELPSHLEASERGVLDYIAGMTDFFALQKYQEIAAAGA